MSDRPRLPYGRQSLDDDDVEAVAGVLRGDWLTTGPLVGEFEGALAVRTGSRHAIAVNSGTAALHTAYFAAGLTRGDSIVTSPLTFVSTASTAIHLGAEVRFADVDPATGNLDPSSVAAQLDSSTRLIVPVDYSGHPADYDAFHALAAERGILVVADAAHSLGATYHGRPAGSLAHASATSFHPVKPITTAEGGAVFTDLDDWRVRAEEFRNHGIVRDRARHLEPDGDWHYEVQSLGLNYRLPDVLCALGLRQLEKLNDFIARRREIAARYSAALGEAEGIELPVVLDGVEPGWHLYVVRVRDAARRRAMFDHLRSKGLIVQLHYVPVHLHPVFRELGFRPGSVPRAEDYAARAISIPIYPAMSDDDVDRVIETVLAASRELL